jgi:hypothetical protein
MKDLLIMFAFGILFFVLGVVFNKKDTRDFEDPVSVPAKLVGYYEYRATNNNSTMYSMEVEYKLTDGTLMHTRERGGSGRMSYPLGTEFDICYSREKPDLFNVYGEKSRKYAIYGMIAVGLAMMAVFGYMIAARLG